MSDRNAVPVLMYHSVGRRLGDWGAAELTTPVDIFEDHLKWLEKRRFQTINLQQLYDSVAHKSPLPERSIVLTFDDGYVDNWTYVVPLLNRYGFSATIAVNPDFIDPRDIVRPTLEDVWSGRIRENELEVRGF
ncbi:MAG: polysaccharide deacetylase family protein, partial [Candidatus Krumholzibacteria bacterium]|nr:polysaccharide deacetylase family protein [Candidatus Krumholzibacteria bacterium]